MGLNLTVEGKKDNHHFLDLQEGTTLLQILLQACYPFASQPSEELNLPQRQS